MNKVICIGEALIDFKETKEGFSMNAGGAPANVCCAVARLGGNSAFLGKLSNDYFSSFLLNNMKKYNIDTSYVVIDNKYKTGLAFVKDGEFVFYHDNSCDLMLDKSEIRQDMFNDGDILHFCSVCLVESPIKYAHLQALKYHKGLVSFDVNIRENLWEDKKQMYKAITSFIPYADIIKVTLDELCKITLCNNEKEGIAYLREMSSKWQIVLVTKGSDGVTAYDRNLNFIYQNAIYVKPVDATGAGDCFIGSILFCILKDKLNLNLNDMKKALAFAAKASSIKVSRKGTMEGMPSYFDMFPYPLFFERNRVYRIYLGGEGYRNLLGDTTGDNMFPEEWIASSVKAINPRYFGIRDGVSVIENTNIFLDDLLNDERILGKRKYDCLVKYLDSAIRLPMQVHPTKEFSRKYFHSEYGKTEAWLIIGVRENAKIYFGFKNEITKEELSLLEERSLEEKDIMRSILNEVIPQVGDVFLIKGGLIHAIGEGCTIIEIQEPTDFTIQPENWCGTYKISEEEKYIGLTKDIALDCFNYSLVGQKAVDSARIIPRVVESNDYIKEALITYDDTPLFSMYRYTLDNGEMTLNYGPSVWIVLEGNGLLFGDGYERSLSKGQYFVLPYACENKFKIKGQIKMIECKGSEE